MNALWFLARKQFFGSLRRAKSRPRLVLPVVFLGGLLLLHVLLPFVLRFFVGNTLPFERREVLFAPPQYTPQSFVTGGPGTLIASIRGLLFWAF